MPLMTVIEVVMEMMAGAWISNLCKLESIPCPEISSNAVVLDWNTNQSRLHIFGATDSVAVDK